VQENEKESMEMLSTDMWAKFKEEGYKKVGDLE
jgi:hypothetical protein